MAAIDDLIAIYARLSLAEIENDASYQNLCLTNQADHVFNRQRHRVEEIKSDLEKTVGIQETLQSQVRYALKLLHQFVPSENQEDEIFLRLVRASYYLKWTDKQKEYFSKTSTVIQTKLDYFLSFTQRNPTGFGNPINSTHRYLIQNVGLPDPQGTKSNELANMLHTMLRISRYKFRGFFFPAHLGDSKEVDKKLKDSLDQSLVFIQLVQNEMFSKLYPGARNYCFDEYSQAVASQKQMILVFADGVIPKDLILKVDVYHPLNNWYQFILGRNCVSLERTQFANESTSVAANLEILKDRLVEGVHAFRKELWEGVPGDLD